MGCICIDTAKIFHKEIELLKKAENLRIFQKKLVFRYKSWSEYSVFVSNLLSLPPSIIATQKVIATMLNRGTCLPTQWKYLPIDLSYSPLLPSYLSCTRNLELIVVRLNTKNFNHRIHCTAQRRHLETYFSSLWQSCHFCNFFRISLLFFSLLITGLLAFGAYWTAKYIMTMPESATSTTPSMVSLPMSVSSTTMKSIMELMQGTTASP